MEFPHENDTCYLAHCYPYTYTDLKDDLDRLLADPIRSQYAKREILCETKVGNNCYLLTVTDFGRLPTHYDMQYTLLNYYYENYHEKLMEMKIMETEVWQRLWKRMVKTFE